MSKKKSNLSGLQFKNPWERNENTVWLASTLSLLRNVEKFKFPAKLSTEKQNQIFSLVSKELSTSSLVKEPVCFRAEEMTPVEKEFLFEHFLNTRSFQEAHVGEGFLVDNSGLFLTTINLQDHIHFMMLDFAGEMEAAHNRLTKIESAIGKTIHYAYSSKFGFLTAHLADCGTGLKVTTYLQTPALIHTRKIEEFLIKHSDEAILVTGLQGRPNEIIGDLLVIHNNYSLGLTEENILTSVRSFTTKLLVREKGLRSKLKSEGSPDIMDKVSRAYGVLAHSYQIDAIEALDALSLLKLGVDVGWVEGVKISALNNLMFNTRRAHLTRYFKEEISNEELPHKRAEFIHKELKNIQLKI